MSDTSELVQATLALDQELERVERLAQAVAQVPLNSRRGLEKAARTTTEAVQAQTLVGERIKVMLEALNGARQRNQATVESLQERSLRMKQRSDELTTLLARFEAIGQEARQITALAQTVAAGQQSDKLPEVDARMGQLAETARGLWQEASDGDWGDVARDADALRQQVLSVKNKLSLIAKRLS